MISENVAVTVAHNVYDIERGIWASDIKAWPGRNGNTFPYGGPYEVTYMTMCSTYPSGVTGSDWALIAFNTDIGSSTGVIDFTYFSDTTLNGIALRIAGYEQDEDILDIGGYYYASFLYQMIGNLSSFTSAILRYQVDTEEGQSGSPVMGLGHVAFGIHYGGYTDASDPYNEGIRITQGIYNVFHACIAEQALSYFIIYCFNSKFHRAFPSREALFLSPKFSKTVARMDEK